MKRCFRLLARPVGALPCIALSLAPAGEQRTKLATDSEAQHKALAEAMRQNSYPISLRDGTLLGPGMQLIARSSATAQFVLFGEEHGVKEFPELLTALFAFLHQNHQFNYLAPKPVSSPATPTVSYGKNR